MGLETRELESKQGNGCFSAAVQFMQLFLEESLSVLAVATSQTVLPLSDDSCLLLLGGEALLSNQQSHS